MVPVAQDGAIELGAPKDRKRRITEVNNAIFFIATKNPKVEIEPIGACAGPEGCRELHGGRDEKYSRVELGLLRRIGASRMTRRLLGGLLLVSSLGLASCQAVVHAF
jgi:hypothetical protein